MGRSRVPPKPWTPPDAPEPAAPAQPLPPKKRHVATAPEPESEPPPAKGNGAGATKRSKAAVAPAEKAPAGTPAPAPYQPPPAAKARRGNADTAAAGPKPRAASVSAGVERPRRGKAQAAAPPAPNPVVKLLEQFDRLPEKTLAHHKDYYVQRADGTQEWVTFNQIPQPVLEAYWDELDPESAARVHEPDSAADDEESVPAADAEAASPDGDDGLGRSPDKRGSRRLDSDEASGDEPADNGRPTRDSSERLRTPYAKPKVKIMFLQACVDEQASLFTTGKIGKAWERLLRKLQEKTNYKWDRTESEKKLKQFMQEGADYHNHEHPKGSSGEANAPDSKEAKLIAKLIGELIDWKAEAKPAARKKSTPGGKSTGKQRADEREEAKRDKYHDSASWRGKPKTKGGKSGEKEDDDAGEEGDDEDDEGTEAFYKRLAKRVSKDSGKTAHWWDLYFDEVESEYDEEQTLPSGLDAPLGYKVKTKKGNGETVYVRYKRNEKKYMEDHPFEEDGHPTLMGKAIAAMRAWKVGAGGSGKDAVRGGEVPVLSELGEASAAMAASQKVAAEADKEARVKEAEAKKDVKLAEIEAKKEIKLAQLALDRERLAAAETKRKAKKQKKKRRKEKRKRRDRGEQDVSSDSSSSSSD